jgi:hypothetical protein
MDNFAMVRKILIAFKENDIIKTTVQWRSFLETLS